MSKMILEGMRVIDFTQIIAGPFAGSILGDMGADVIHVEQPGCGDRVRGIIYTMGHPTALNGGRHALFEYLNRNKRGLTVDVKRPAGREIMYKLVESADVFLTNMGRDLLVESALDYAHVSQVNPKIVYVSSSSYGPKGPDADRPGYDLLAQAKCGLMSLAGEPGWPPTWAAPGLVDQSCGVTMAFAAVSALLARERYGIGQEVTTSLLGSALALEAYVISVTSLTQREFGKEQRAKATNPLYNWYRCADDRWIVLGLLQSDRHWEAFCRAIGRPDLENDDRFSDMFRRREHSVLLIQILDDLFATKTVDEWAKLLEREQLLFMPVQRIQDVLADPQAFANDYLVEVAHPVLGRVNLVGSPIAYGETPVSIRSFAPECGEHSEELLAEICGYEWQKIEELREQGVI